MCHTAFVRAKRILAGEDPEPEEARIALEGEFMGAFLAKKELPRSPAQKPRGKGKDKGSHRPWRYPLCVMQLTMSCDNEDLRHDISTQVNAQLRQRTLCTVGKPGM